MHSNKGVFMIKTIKDTKAYVLLKSKDSPFISQIEDLYEYADKFLPQINRLFSNYTGHGMAHSLNVTDYMFEIIDKPELLSDLEIVTLIYSALLHDIGMAVTEAEIDSIKNDDDVFSSRKYTVVLSKYQNELVALQECIRPTHGKRSHSHIMNMDEKHFMLPGSTAVSFKEDVAKICAAHNESFEWLISNMILDQRKGEWALNSQYIAMLLRIADYLDIDEERAPFYLYQFLNPKDYGDLEWQQHYVIENKDKIYVDEKTGKKNIEIYGESANPEIHRKLLKYFDAVNGELKNAIDYSETFRDKKYLLSIGSSVHNKIRTKGFAFSDFKLALDYKAVTNLLMGENIYGDEKYGLRELVQNSIDACMIMAEESKKNEEFKYSKYNPFISIILDKERKQAIIFDNGKGMSIDILKKYFLNVGVSYYVSDDYLFQGNNYSPIGNYGIGFLACFMLSDTVSVVTKYYGESQINKIDFEKSSEYICLTFEEKPRSQGTEIVLDYDKFMSAFSGKESNVEEFIRQNFVDCSIPISLVICKEGSTTTKSINLKKIGSFYPESIRLDRYFDGIEVEAKFSYKGIQYLEFFSDISCDESLVYQEKTNALFKEEEIHPRKLLKDFIDDGSIKYLRVPIITPSEEDEFIKSYEVLDDFDEALDKINYEQANIIAEDSSLYNESQLIRYNYDYIVDFYSLSDFRSEVGHSQEAPTYTYLEKKKVIHGSGNKILPYDIEKYFRGKYSFQWKDSLYIKNVLISSAHIKIPFLAEGIELKGLVINAVGKKIVPNISRNNISEPQLQFLSYAIGRAIHLWICDEGGLQVENKQLMQGFLEKCYPDKNEYMK
ncbi:hypothetical protein EQM06_03860 [Aminipila luticellarii]|uniref:HD-CE domain-containing protein n=2 Tax=Aminipila luticellarii TaxID=2507160 RepID=A0A410PTY4_9FIRM|nr:hypothetical protein EQM06_03860 [Aminipila luticellarii]